MFKGSLVVDRSLRGVKIEKLLDARRRPAVRETVSMGAARAQDKAELGSGEDLRPNHLYRSTKDPSRRYYLPKYTIARRDGHPEVTLRYDPKDDEVGRLSITLEWTPPSYGAGELRMIDHRTDLELHYHLPIKGETWEGPEQVVQLQPPLALEGNRAQSVTVITDKEQFDSIYQAMREEKYKPALELHITAEVGVKTWRQVMTGRPARIDQANALDEKRALFTKLLSRDQITDMRRLNLGRASVSVRELSSSEARDIRNLRMLTNDNRAISTRTLSTAVSNPRLLTTMPRLVNGRVGASTAVLNALRANPALLRTNPNLLRTATSRRIATRPTLTARPQPQPTLTARPQPQPTLTARPQPQPTLTRRPRPQPTLTPRPQPQPQPRPQPQPQPTSRPTTPARPTPTFTPAVRPPALEAFSRAHRPESLRTAIERSDLKVKDRGTMRRAVPLNIAMGRDRQPAVIDTEAEHRQALPFAFDPGTNAGVYVVGDDFRSVPHVLRRIQLGSGSDQVYVYLDGLLQNTVYVPPSEFRLVREDVSPFAPAIKFVAGDFALEGEGDEDSADILYRVAMVYRLQPWLDPKVVQLVHAQWGPQMLLSPIDPRKATLTLDVLGDSQTRDDAVIDPLNGITDTLELDGDEFARLWSEQLAHPSGAGIPGTVTFKLFDNTEHTCDAKISLAETSTELLDVMYLGLADEEGHVHQIQLRNRIESPVQVQQMPTLDLGDGIHAIPMDAAALVGRQLLPQEQVTARYRVDDTSAAVAQLLPPVPAAPQLNSTAKAALLKLLMTNTGFESLGFSVTVKAAAGSFDPVADSAAPLIGLRVEFDDGSEVELTPDDDEQEVGLLGRIVDQLLGEQDEQQRYLYRVTNLHPDGDGARTNWFDRAGEGVLEVTPAKGETIPFGDF